MAVVSKNNSKHYKWGNNCDGWHLVKTDNLSVIQECVPYGSSEIRHFHNKAEQFFYVLSGEATIKVESDLYVIKKNQGIYIPKGTFHQLKNELREDLVFIVTSVPPSHGDRVEI